MLVTGSILQGRYRIERVLGHGGMGAVYLATEEHLGGKRVAIKEMSVQIDDPVERASATQQFEREARILATLDHPGLVDVSHYFEENGKQYLVMAFVDGKTLEQILNQAKTFLSEPQVVDWLDQVCDVVEYLHGQDPPIIFRDMKPSNVMVDARGRCRLIDFGIARSFDKGNKTATFIKGAGTAGFAPLEQYGKKGTTDPRTDIYAIGATAYTLLTRTIPPAAVDMALNDEKLVLPSKINPKVSAGVETAILTMMAIKKEDRYQSVAAARQALRLAMPPSAETLSFRRPRFCPSCNQAAPGTSVVCPRCGSALEEAKLVDVDTVPGEVKSESTAIRSNTPAPNLQPKVMETSHTDARLPASGVSSTEPRLAAPQGTEPNLLDPRKADAPSPAVPVEPSPEAPLPPVAVSSTVSQHSRRTSVSIVLGLIGVALILVGLHPPQTPHPEPSPSPTASVSVALPESPSPSLSSPSPSAAASETPVSPAPSASAAPSAAPQTSGSPAAGIESSSPAATVEPSVEASASAAASVETSATPEASGSPEAGSGSP